ncbi:hypothetical protein [Saccharopolyspora sp. SCSIO 74807]|uniref:hypothetical protein n=2 Tax=unclassified Saccharopolyspora TaxID=2646250 RepID=UPI0030CB9D03
MAGRNTPAMGTPTTPRAYGLPCIWHHEPATDLTFRWGRGDGCITVLTGRHNGRETAADVLATFPAPACWLEQNELTTRARHWLARRNERR